MSGVLPTLLEFVSSGGRDQRGSVLGFSERLGRRSSRRSALHIAVRMWALIVVRDAAGQVGRPRDSTTSPRL